MSSSAEVPSVLHQQTHLPVHVSTIWTGNFSMGVLYTLRLVVHLLHLQGVCLHVYLDDWLIWADSLEMASSHVQLMRPYENLVSLFDDNTAASTIISHRTSVGSVLKHWKYDPTIDPNVKMLLRGIRFDRPVQQRSMPQWNLHLWPLLLMWLIFNPSMDKQLHP